MGSSTRSRSEPPSQAAAASAPASRRCAARGSAVCQRIVQHTQAGYRCIKWLRGWGAARLQGVWGGHEGGPPRRRAGRMHGRATQMESGAVARGVHPDGGRGGREGGPPRCRGARAAARSAPRRAGQRTAAALPPTLPPHLVILSSEWYTIELRKARMDHSSGPKEWANVTCGTGSRAGQQGGACAPGARRGDRSCLHDGSTPCP